MKSQQSFLAFVSLRVIYFFLAAFQFLTGFQQLEYYVIWCGFLRVTCALGLLKFFNSPPPPPNSRNLITPVLNCLPLYHKVTKGLFILFPFFFFLCFSLGYFHHYVFKFTVSFVMSMLLLILLSEIFTSETVFFSSRASILFFYNVHFSFVIFMFSCKSLNMYNGCTKFPVCYFHHLSFLDVSIFFLVMGPFIGSLHVQ